MTSKTVALLINVGSPDEPTVPALRRYLAQFLMDKYILDMPWLWRALIVYGLILPRRPKRSAHAYASIWTSDGSPLVSLTKQLVEIITQSSPFPVHCTMRCGSPSIEETIKSLDLNSSDTLVVIPMYPQYAESTTRSALEEVTEVVAKTSTAKIYVKKPFYSDDAYIDIWAKKIQPVSGEYTLFSFHGLPVRQLRKADPTEIHCMGSKRCCQGTHPAHDTCYRHQCLVTAEKIAKKLGLRSGTWSVSFQSRLGRDEWLSPSTENELKRLPQRGNRNIRVVCGSFTTDCLETLEEIAMAGRQTFMDAGGTEFNLAPCPNTDPAWASLINHWLSDYSNSDNFSAI